ncbi:hypothetical protein GCM10009839_04850 [Catenulispora yoronensis]|uniref:CdiI immunity protein domain-containing protein n=1 Tax=Catenulispora yoronensis TaxID=450799 RepID=A0ABN2TLN3_9ACTN
MGFNGEVLVGRGEAFIGAIDRFWNWYEEVLADWPLRDGWHAVHVRTPAFGDELAELAQAVDGPILACWVFESDLGHVRGISDAGQWEAWLNPAYAAQLHAMTAVDEENSDGSYPSGTPRRQARREQLEMEYAAELDADRPAAARAAAAWAAQSGLHVDAAHLEEILATRWELFAQRGFFAMLAVLGLADPKDKGSEAG